MSDSSTTTATTEPTTTVEVEPIEPVEKAGAEAAKYRRQLREAEAQRDALNGRLEAMQRAEVERLAGTTIARPNALWSAGADLADLLDEAGNVDAEKVTTAAELAAETLGLAAPIRNPRPDFSQGMSGDREPKLDWSEALRA